MADPVGIAFAPTSSTLATSPTWVRLDDPAQTWRVTGYQIQRGRSSELDRTETGTATVGLIDLDGSFDPTNTGGPFYGDLDPMKQAAITIQNPVTDEWRHLFKGFVSEWVCQVDKTGQLAETALELVDGMDFLAAVEMAPGASMSTPYFGMTVPAASEGDIYFAATDGTEQVRARIDQVLDDVGWPAGERHIFSGNIDLREVTYARREQALSAIVEAAEAEFPGGVAQFFFSRRGTAVFRGRYARFDPTAYIATDDDDLRTGPAGYGGRLWEWSCGGREQAEADTANVAWISEFAWRRSKLDVINAAICTPKRDGTSLTEADLAGLLYKDNTSIAAYGWRMGIDAEDLLVAAGNTTPGQTALEECRLYSEAIVENYKAPKTRITRLVFRGLPLTDPCAPATWALICGVELGDPIHVETTHWDGAGGFDDDYLIEGIRYDARPAAPGVPDITLTLDVSPQTFYTHNPWGTTTTPDA